MSFSSSTPNAEEGDEGVGARGIGDMDLQPRTLEKAAVRHQEHHMTDASAIEWDGVCESRRLLPGGLQRSCEQLAAGLVQQMT
ncbi:hypothetical protein GN956_G5170 [Arapaima gigas]